MRKHTGTNEIPTTSKCTPSTKYVQDTQRSKSLQDVLCAGKKTNLANHSCNDVTTRGVVILISKERKVPFEPNAMLNMYMCNYVPDVLTVGQKPVWSIAAAALSVFFGLALSSPCKEENITCTCTYDLHSSYIHMTVHM